MNQPIQIRRAERRDIPEWLRLRRLLWPGNEHEDWRPELRQILADPSWEAFVATKEERLVGFLEAHLREYAEGCASSPVGFIEGWYVEEKYRRSGIGRKLVEAAERWAIDKGCTEMASDALIDNSVSHKAHRALQYQEVERQICFRKTLHARKSVKSSRTKSKATRSTSGSVRRN